MDTQKVEQLIQNKQAIAIMGPTASGKSGLSMLLAQVLPIEIISVDSALIYQQMDIGTAKPSQQEMAEVPHHLVNILSPEQTYSASEFVEDVHQLVEQIFARGKLPVLVGGTMMYFNALQKGMAELPSADETIRARLLADWQADPEGQHAKLNQVDPEAAERIHYNDQQRVCRALEVYELTGKPLSQHQKEGQGNGLSAFKLIKIALMPEDRKALHQQIEVRFKQMLSQNLIEEVKVLKQNPNLHPDLPSIRSVGYRQAWSFLEGEYDDETFVDKSLVATRQLAKRQMTWLRKEQNICALDSLVLSKESLLKQSLDYIEGFCD